MKYGNRLARLGKPCIALLAPLIMSSHVSIAQPTSQASADPYSASSPLSKGHVPLAERIAHTEPSKWRTEQPHNGPAPLHYGDMFASPFWGGNRNASTTKFNLGTNLIFLHHGELPAGGGIGAHFHNYCEEMFVILSGEAQFTVDGRTSVLKGPAGVPARSGHSHAIYNASDKPAEWMNINVSSIPGVYDASNLGDPRVGVPLDPIPQFITMRLDRNLLRASDNFESGKGEVLYRRALGPSTFFTPWSYVDHLLLAPGASIGPISKQDMSEVFYVMNGEGSATIGTDTVPFKKGDAVPAALGESRKFVNTGTTPLEFMVIGIARDLETKRSFMISEARKPRPSPSASK